MELQQYQARELLGNTNKSIYKAGEINIIINFMEVDAMFDLFDEFGVFKDLSGIYYYDVTRKDERIIVHNVLGLGKDDIEITVESNKNGDYLIIHGEKENEITNETHNIEYDHDVDLDEIDEIEYKVENGLLYIFVKLKKPEKPEINIRYRD